MKKSYSEKNFRVIAQKCMINDWTVSKLVGKGQSGKAYVACDDGDCDYIVKIQPNNKDYKHEIKVLNELQGMKGIPKLYATWICGKDGYMIIEKLYKCSKNPRLYYRQIGNILKNMKKRDWLHVDTHKKNFMCNSKGSPVLIDFGYAVHRKQGTYKDHPISRGLSGFAPTYDYLKELQMMNYEMYFGTKRNNVKLEKAKEYLNSSIY